ncbi:MAG: hypothetical protein IPN69_22570 [Acidobacteria bacterium]|nr:hypothetical protein [Acidobacteriota bacterium]
MGFGILDFSRITENNGSLRSQNITFAGLTTAYDQTYTYDDLNRIKSAEAKVGAAESGGRCLQSASQTFTHDAISVCSRTETAIT